MEYSNNLKKIGAGISAEQAAEIVAHARTLAEKNNTPEIYRRCFGCVDLTSLNCTDSHDSIQRFVSRAAQLPMQYPSIPGVASVCVYPIFVETAGIAIGDSRLAITSVAGGFPASQTYIEVKILEAAMAVENGADEIDIVINIGELLSGEYDLMGNEIEALREEIGEEVILKVILESGLLEKPELIHRAAWIAMLAGADFIKTSTGKTNVAATPEAAVIMCHAIRDFAIKTGRKVGFKAAGGVSSAADAALYYTIVEMILGDEWLNPDRFRIGASSLANNLLTAIEGRSVVYF